MIEIAFRTSDQGSLLKQHVCNSCFIGEGNSYTKEFTENNSERSVEGAGDDSERSLERAEDATKAGSRHDGNEGQNQQDHFTQ